MAAENDKTAAAPGTPAAAGAGANSSPAAPSSEGRTQPTPSSRTSGAAALAQQSSRTSSVHAGASGSGTQSQAGKEDDQTSKTQRKVEQVRVLVDNLGPKRYRKGEIVDDPEVVALIDDGTERVGRVEVC